MMTSSLKPGAEREALHELVVTASPASRGPSASVLYRG